MFTSHKMRTGGSSSFAKKERVTNEWPMCKRERKDFSSLNMGKRNKCCEDTRSIPAAKALKASCTKLLQALSKLCTLYIRTVSVVSIQMISFTSKFASRFFILSLQVSSWILKSHQPHNVFSSWILKSHQPHKVISW